MKTSSILVAALASGLLFPPLAQGAAAPAGAGALKSLTPAAPAVLTLVKGGGGGAHMGGGHMGGAGIHMGGVHMGHAQAFTGGGVRFHTSPSFSYSGRSHVYAGRGFDKAYSSRKRHYQSYAWKGDHDNWNGHHRGHYRHYYPGPYVYGGGYGYDGYGYDDCYWLRRQAIVTGSPVWWRRYHACAG